MLAIMAVSAWHAEIQRDIHVRQRHDRHDWAAVIDTWQRGGDWDEAMS